MAFDRADWEVASDVAAPAAEAANEAADAAQQAADLAATKADAAQGAAQQAKNTADAAKQAAEAVSWHVWADDAGVHVTTEDGDATEGPNVLLDGLGMNVRSGEVELARFSAKLAELGMDSDDSTIRMCGGKGSITTVTSATLGSVLMMFASAIGLSANSALQLTSGAGVRQSARTLVDSMVSTGAPNVSAHGSLVQQDSESWGVALTNVNDANGNPDVDHERELSVERESSGETTLCLGTNYIYAGTNGDLRTPMPRLATTIQPVVLYNGGATLDYDIAPGWGTTGTVTLSETSANFRRLTIYGRYDTMYTSVEVTSPNGKDLTMQFFIPDGGPSSMVYIKSSRLQVSGTHITNSGWLAMWLSASTNHFDATSAPEINVVRVEGVR